MRDDWLEIANALIDEGGRRTGALPPLRLSTRSGSSGFRLTTMRDCLALSGRGERREERITDSVNNVHDRVHL